MTAYSEFGTSLLFTLIYTLQFLSMIKINRQRLRTVENNWSPREIPFKKQFLFILYCWHFSISVTINNFRNCQQIFTIFLSVFPSNIDFNYLFYSVILLLFWKVLLIPSFIFCKIPLVSKQLHLKNNWFYEESIEKIHSFVCCFIYLHLYIFFHNNSYATNSPEIDLNFGNKQRSSLNTSLVCVSTVI